MLAFKNEGGLDVLNTMLKVSSQIVLQGAGTSHEDSTKHNMAAFGLRKVLELYLMLVNGKHFAESSNHFNLLPRTVDRSQNTANIFQQIVVEFRAAILPQITELWGSSLVEKVNIQTVTPLLDILKTISTGEHEPQSSSRDRVRTDASSSQLSTDENLQAQFSLFTYTMVRFDWPSNRGSVEDLVNGGFDTELVHEAVFRANGHVANARDYCRSHKAGLAGPRHPIPLDDADTSALQENRTSGTEHEPSNISSASEADRMSLDGPPELSSPDLAERFLGDNIGEFIIENSSQTTEDTGETPDVNMGTRSEDSQQTPVRDSGSRPQESNAATAKDEVNEHRAKLRETLIDRCLDVIRAHPGSAIEVAELIHVTTSRQPNNELREEVGLTLSSAITSLALDDEEKKRNGKCIAAYAHLLALLLQDQEFFNSNIDTLRDKVGEYSELLTVPNSVPGEEMPPWIPYILLVAEVLLCHDERPVAAQWKAPKSLDEDVNAPVVQLPARLVGDEQRSCILESLMEFLPRIGKEETLATSILRVLVILTRDRTMAKQVGDKRNLQRLFLMAKQLSGSGSERLKHTRLTTHIMIILRHIVEDEETIKQIMRAEIKSSFSTLQRSQRGHTDVAAYLRSMSPVALRAPDLFVKITNEMLRFSRWSHAAGSTDHARLQPLALKESETGAHKSDEKPEEEDVVTTSASATQDIKQSTECADKEMSDVPKGHHESKRPVVENPDGVIHFLLSELVNYKEVDDKETPALGKDIKPVGESPVADDTASASKEASGADGKDKKTKPVFKAEEHPIFVYRCFLLNCLAELLQSYNRTKIEFIDFKRSAPPPTTNTPIKPRSSVLNYLIYDLLCQGNLSGAVDSIAAKKKAATSVQTQKVLVALVAKTSEQAIDRSKGKYEYDEEPDLLFVRKFVLDTMLKAYERAPTSDEPFETRYSRMQCLAELMNCMLGEREKDQSTGSRSPDYLQSRSQSQMRRLMYEKGYLDKLTSSIAEINLNYPGVKRAIKYILRALRILTDTAKELSHSSILPADSQSDHTDDDIGSTSSLSDLDDDREETPDLYRNSALGMLEPRGEDDESDEDEDDDDEDMYGDEYDDDEMDYGEDDITDAEEDISDEDDELSGMGDIEGLHGDPGVVEVIMDDDDDDDDEDSDDDDDDDDDDEVESADMEDVEDHIEILDEDGNPIDDDGNSGWESEDHDEDDEDPDEDLDYEADVHDEDEAHVHGLDGGQLLDGMARALLGSGADYHQELLEGLDDHYIDEGHDEEEDDDDDEDIEEEEYIYDDDYPMDDQVPPMPALGWDSLNPDMDDRQRQMFMMDHQNRRRVLGRMESRSPFPQGFMVGGHRDAVGDFRSFFSRAHRPSGTQPGADDGVNPLLRRNEQIRDSVQRTGHQHSIGLRLPEGIFGNGRPTIEGPMGFLGELMEFLPLVGRAGPHAFHLQISGGPRDAREIIPMRGSRGEQRREGSAQEPQQAVSFAVESTLDRYQEEARMIFVSGDATKLSTIIIAKLAPAAIELEKKVKAEEAETQRKFEEQRKKLEEEQRLAREAKEAVKKVEKEKKEAEEREAAAARAASEAAASSQQAEARVNETANQSNAMEGVETGPTPIEPADSQGENTGGSDESRVMTTIRGEEVDVTELGIDPDYLAALPEEFREEVIAQTVSTRRSQAREEAPTGESTEVFQEFLDALPEELRLEIAQQERQEQRRRAREDSSRQPPQPGTERLPAPEMDTASILLTFPPELREQVLMDQGADIMDQLPPEMAAQARALNSQGHSRAVITGRSPPQLQPPPGGPAGGQTENKIQRRTVVQMLDKAGVATLLRLMFIAQQGSIRAYLFNVFADVCENRQNRLEVVSTLLQILQEGSTDMNAVERSFGQLSLKARRPKDKDRDTEQKTPQTLKRTLSTLNSGAAMQTNSETSPLLVVQQCLDLLVDLSTKNLHVPWLFLTEHEIVGSTLKRALGRKGKAKDKDSKAHKYAINSLLTLLDRDLVMESSVVMTHLADLLNRVTMPLQNLERRRKEAEDEVKAVENKATDVDEAAEEHTDNQAGTIAASTSAVETTSTEPAETSNAQPGTGDDNVKEQEEKKDAARKKLRHLQPPVIPPQNLTLAVRIFVARECSSKTFQNTISTIKNLSAIPGAKAVFGQELVRQARLLSENIVSDLDELLPHIEKASSGTEIQGVALAKFSPGASEQNKLLRVLTALDHLFDNKKKAEEPEVDEGKDERQDLVTSLYHNSTFSAMWEKLSLCLSAIRQRENMLNVATILLPLIESLMVVCKNTTTGDDPTQSQGTKEMVLSSPPPESQTASLFFNFTEDHRRILNELVRNNPKLMSGTFALLVKNPKVLEFDNKRNYFSRSVHSRAGQGSNRPSYPSLQLAVRREHVFHDSFKSLYFKTGDEMKFGKLNIRFHGEEGVDAGGVTREWFQVLARQMFDPNYVLFTPVSSDRTTFHPNKLSGINDEHLMFFKFIGRIIGKALYEGRVLDCYFSRAVYKRILGKSVSVKDMESFDPDYYKSLCWMLENDITDIITETFSVEDDEFGVTNVVDLIPNGREIAVTEENKSEYVRLVVEHKLLSSVKDQMENFLKGTSLIHMKTKVHFTDCIRLPRNNSCRAHLHFQRTRARTSYFWPSRH